MPEGVSNGMDPDQGFTPAPEPIVPKAPLQPQKPKRQLNLNFPVIAAIVLGAVCLILAALLFYYMNQANQSQAEIDQQKAEAATIAADEQKKVDEADFAEREKQPYRTYEAPAVLGAIKVEFPKNWNVYALEEEKGQVQLDVFMYPGVVRDQKSTTEPYAFRLKLEQKLYTENIKKYQQLIEKGVLRARPQSVSGIEGTRFDGEIEQGRTGALILLPVRDKSLFLWTESNNYLADYDQIISKISITP